MGFSSMSYSRLSATRRPTSPLGVHSRNAKKKWPKSCCQNADLSLKLKISLSSKNNALKTIRKEFLTLHKLLSQTILEAAPSFRKLKRSSRIFTFPSKISLPYMITSRKVYSTILEHFIVKPFEHLKQAWIERSYQELLNSDPEIRYKRAL